MGCGFSCRREPWKKFNGHPILAKYKLQQKIGAGAFSEVWRAVHIETGNLVALKVVFWGNPDLKDHHKRILRKEVEVLGELRHDHIVKMLDDKEDENQLVMALEYLKGGGLLEHLFEVEHYTEAQAAYLFTQMAKAIQFMHSKGIMHRDIKPENVVFSEPVSGLKAKNARPTLKLVDFGLARHYSSTRSVKARLGSPGFMSPETIEYQRHTPAMDMFSLGVMLFTMLTGHKPMKSDQAQSLSYSLYEASDYPKMTNWTWKRLSARAQSLVLQLMERDPAKRLTADQVMAHEWIITCGGTKPVPLDQVGKQATRLGRERKFKGLAHAVIAGNRFQRPSASGKAAGSKTSRAGGESSEIRMSVTGKCAKGDSERLAAQSSDAIDGSYLDDAGSPDTHTAQSGDAAVSMAQTSAIGSARRSGLIAAPPAQEAALVGVAH